MSYIRKTLGNEEDVILEADHPWAWYAIALLWVVLAVALAILLWLATPAPWTVGLLLILVGATVTLAQILPLWCTEIAVTDQRVILKQGCLRRQTRELGLRHIEQISLDQSLLGRMLGYGKLIIRGTGEGQIQVPEISDPVGFRRAVESARHEAFSGNGDPEPDLKS